MNNITKTLAYSARALISLLCAGMLSAETAFAAEYTLTPVPSDQLPAAVAKAEPSVVSILISKPVPQTQAVYGAPIINSSDPNNVHVEIPVGVQPDGTAEQVVGIGSGFIGTHDGRIITAKHVVADPNAQYSVVLSDGTEKPASVIYRDPNNDIAIVKIDGEYADTAMLGDSASLSSGQEVIAIGNASQYGQGISQGSVVGFDRSINANGVFGEGPEHLTGLIETTAPMVPGYSGGPTVDENGSVVGMSIAVNAQNGRGYAIPIDAVKASLAAAARS